MKQNQTTQNPETPSIKGNQTLTSPIAIIGMALSGEASLRLLLNLGYSRSHIKTYDQKMMAHTDTTDINELIDFKPKTLIVSPGVPLSLPWIQKLLNQGATLLNEIDLAAPYLESEKVIGITGSIGKSTTAALVAEAANAWTPHVFLGGNFGDPLVNYISDVIEKKRPRADLLVIELSSYHLETLQNSIFDLSAITYFTANHLERYDSIDSYYKTKWKLTQLTKGICYLNKTSLELVNWSQSQSQKNIDFYETREDLFQSLNWSKMKMIGLHNQENIACAAKLIYEILQLTKQEHLSYSKQIIFNNALEKLLNFKGLSHRMENLGTIKNALFVNDSKATTIESVLTAVKGVLGQFTQTQNLFILLGGKDKNLPWQDLQILAQEQRLKPYFFGSCASLAQQKSALEGPLFKSLEACLDALKIDLQKSEYLNTQNIVLLSPGGTSLDEFKSFEHRGQFFKEKVTQF